MTYNGTILSETITDNSSGASFSTSYTVDIPTIVGGSTAFVGFTGATGGLTAVQDIQSWQGNFGPQIPNAPTISSLSPNTIQEGTGGFTLTVFGSGFVAGATVQWSENGTTTTLTPSSVSSGQLQVFVPNTLLAVGKAGTVSVNVTQVINQIPLTSNAVPFTITPISTGVPAITSLSPNTIQEGIGGFVLTVSGSGFASSATVQWTQNGVMTTLAPFFVSSSQLLVLVPGTLLTVGHAGTVSVNVTQVINQIPVTSNTATFTIGPTGDPPLSAIGKDITATVSVAQDFTVAQFTDADPNARTGSYAVPINWGDGTAVVAGRVTQPGGPGTTFFVDATHAYSSTGTFTVHVRIFDEAGAFAETFSTATVVSGAAPGGAARSGGGTRGIGAAPVAAVGQQFQAGTFQVSSNAALAVLPIQSSTSLRTGRTSPADDMYWQVLSQQRGDGLTDPNGWIANELAVALKGNAVS
jgi:hypothetical protein